MQKFLSCSQQWTLRYKDQNEKKGGEISIGSKNFFFQKH